MPFHRVITMLLHYFPNLPFWQARKTRHTDEERAQKKEP